MTTAQFGDKGQFTYNVDSKGNPYGAPITKPVSNAPQTLQQGQPYMGGIVNYDAQTGLRLAPGATTTLPPVTPPTNTGNVTQTNPVVIPNSNYSSPDTSKANAAAASSASNTKSEQQQIQDFYDKMEADTKANAEQNKTLLSNLMGSQKSAATLTTEEEAKYGVDAQAHIQKKQALEASYDSLNKDYTDTKNAMEAEKLAVADRLATTGSISAQQAAIEQKYAPTLNRMASEVNYASAKLARENGDFTEAEALVEKAVNLKLADQKQNLDMNLALFQANQDTFNKMEGIYKDAFVAHINSLEKQYTEAHTDATAVGKLAIDYPHANISLNDTLAQATAKVQASGGNTSSTIIGSSDTGYRNIIKDSQGKIISNTPISGGAGGVGGGGSSGIKLTNTQINKGAANANVSPTEFKKLDPLVQNYLVNNYSAFASSLEDAKNGTVSPDDMRAHVNDSGTIPQPVKNYLNEVINKEFPPKKSGGGVWDTIKSWFGGGSNSGGASPSTMSGFVGH